MYVYLHICLYVYLCRFFLNILAVNKFEFKSLIHHPFLVSYIVGHCSVRNVTV